MSILNADNTKKGYENGLRDATENRAKDYTGLVSSLKSWLLGNKAMDSYVKGYDIGYENGLSKSHEIYYQPIIHSQSGVMMNTGQNIHTLADSDSISDFYNALSQFSKNLSDKTIDLKNFIVSMQSHSWDDENYLKFRQLFSRITHRVEGIEGSVIDQSMLPILQAHIDKIRQAQMEG